MTDYCDPKLHDYAPLAKDGTSEPVEAAYVVQTLVPTTSPGQWVRPPIEILVADHLTYACCAEHLAAAVEDVAKRADRAGLDAYLLTVKEA